MEGVFFMRIANKSDCFIAYELLKIYKEQGRENSDKAQELKRRIRAFNHREPVRNIVKDNGMDGCVELVQFPDFMDDLPEAEAEIFFRENYEIEPVYSVYDCTGRPFTAWYKIFKRRGHWHAYHAIAYDV